MATQESQQVKAGRLGGEKVLKKKGRKYFAKLASKRKTFGGGRPKGSKNKPKPE